MQLQIRNKTFSKFEESENLPLKRLQQNGNNMEQKHNVHIHARIHFVCICVVLMLHEPLKLK